MPDTKPPKDDDGVDRGQRVRREMRLDRSHDGRERMRSARPMRKGRLPADMTNARSARPTVEDVVDLQLGASSWEALEDEEEARHPPPARGVGRPVR